MLGKTPFAALNMVQGMTQFFQVWTDLLSFILFIYTSIILSVGITCYLARL